MSSNEEIINKLNALKDEFMNNLYKDKAKADEIRAQIKQVLQDAPDGTEMYRVIQETSSGWTAYGSYSDTRATMKTLKKENGVWEMYGRKKNDLDDASSSIVFNDGKLMSKSDAQAELDRLKVNDSSSHRDIVNVGTDKWGNSIGQSTNRIEYPNKKEEDNGMLTPIPDELKEPSEVKPWTSDMYMEYYYKMADAVAEEYKAGDIDFIKSRMKNYNLPETEINDDNIKQVINDIAFAYADEKARRYKLIKTEAVSNDDGYTLVSTGLSDAKAEDVLNSVIGQMSDGIWENTSQMDRYWKNLEIVKKDGELYIQANTDSYSSGFKGYTEDEIRKFVANKVKQIAKMYIEDYKGSAKDLAWDRNCTVKCDYLDYHSGATIQDAYRVYDKLLGRKDRIKTEEYFICGRCLKGVDLDYNVEDYVVDPETGEAMCRDCAIKAGIPVDDDLEENKEIEKHREDKLNKLNSDIMYNFNEAYKDWGKELAPNKTAFIDDYMDAFQDDFSYGDVNWKDYIVAIPELDDFYQEYSDVEDYEIPEDMKLKFYNLITEYVQNYIKSVCTDKITESVDNCVGEPLSSVLADLGDGIDVADADYDMMVWMPSYTIEDDVSDIFDKLVQFIESKILVKEEFNKAEDAVIVAGVGDFIKDNKQIFIDEVDIPEDIKDEQDIEEYLVCTVFPALVSGYATDSLYTNIYNKLNGGK